MYVNPFWFGFTFGVAIGAAIAVVTVFTIAFIYDRRKR